MDILQLPLLALRQRIQEELAENPVLDLEEVARDEQTLLEAAAKEGNKRCPGDAVPDIVVKRTENGNYEVRLLDDWEPTISVSPRYLELYRDKSCDPKAKAYLTRKIQAAQVLIELIEQRRSILEKVSKAIIQHQRSFLDHGPEFLQPLTMQQIADQVGLDVTTVSQAVKDKWVQTPRGMFPLKRFFAGGTNGAK